ncbi:MAG: HEAT repeat domain-containing protein, partial [Candidatus Thorarchaeota archaeon]
MSKKARHKSDLLSLFAAFPNSSAEEKIANYILSNSNLPGRRANLELANALMEVVAELSSSRDVATLWEYCYQLTAITIEEGPVNTPREFLPFCGTCGLGAIGAMHPDFLPEALQRLQELATDARWRMREAVRMALQQLLAGKTTTVQQALEQWVEKDNWLVLRAVATSTGEQCLKMD